LLKLKRVDIHGFKSFYDRTELKFHGVGIAAIVGPNGCGKSNISDAISWVLGEQSAKSLRGSRMEDVIFAGTRERSPLGMAQVTLTMVDPQAHTPLPGKPIQEIEAVSGAEAGAVNGHGQRLPQPKPQEFTITRRLYRSGESEYLIDGKIARLRDIQDLFTGTGLGPESYAIIEQGRIGQILSNKPADRRAVMEEAAGVGRFKNRKRLAEAKLESARQNLARVFDILEEVSRQVNSLKRQASKARRYQELRAEMAAHLQRAVAGRFRVLEREAAGTALELGQAQAAFHELAARTAAKEREYSATQESCYRVEAGLTAARARVAEGNLEAERIRGRLEMQAGQIGAIGEKLAAGEAESQGLEERLGREREELDAMARATDELEGEAAALRERLAAKAAERDALHNDLRERSERLEAARARVLRLLGEASTLRNQLAQIDEYLAAIDRDSARLRGEEEAATADLARLEQTRTGLAAKLSARRTDLGALADRRRQVEETLKSKQAAAAAGRPRLDEVRGTLARQKARRDSLEEILSHRAYTTESVKRLFTAIERGQAEGFKPSGVLADFVEMTDPAWEKACETYLHDELEYIVVESWADAERGMRLIGAESDGQATFLVRQEGREPAEAPDLSRAPGVNGRLIDVLRMAGGFSRITSKLARCYLAADRAAARGLAAAHPELYFLLPDGVCYHGPTVTGGRKAAGGPLALKRELRELAGQVDAREREADALTAELEELEREAARLAEELEAVRADQQSREKETLALDHEERKLAEESARAASRRAAARLQLERLSREDQLSRAQREQSQAAVAEREDARFEQEKALELERAGFERVQSRAHSAGEEHAAVRAGLAGLDERLRAHRTTRARLESQVDQTHTRRQELESELARLGVERARLLADNLELDQRAAELAAESAAAAAAVERLAAEETAGRAALAALEEQRKGLRGDSQAAQERRAAVEVELVRKQADLRSLEETSRRELGQAAAAIAQAAAEEIDDAAVAEAESSFEETRLRVEALGPVNPQALEEHREAQERYDFLNTQRQDLLDSIRDTEKAIHDLDVESRRRFQEAFAAINENFRLMFRTLFGGGQAEMRLTDDTNLAESGIDIMASPPGKKLQNIALLSGGEKSLTAMALLLAVFRYAPSPFCILDEVDAPLDEPNIQRLTRLLQEMARETQFIVITHARKTMEASQALYGVTMQEPGISKLVSVRFDAAHAEPLPAPPAAVAAV
jgi:chromosome segregation protein